MIFSQSNRAGTQAQQSAQIAETEYTFSTQLYCPELDLWYKGESIDKITKNNRPLLKPKSNFIVINSSYEIKS